MKKFVNVMAVSAAITFSDFIIHRIHRRVLRYIKSIAEGERGAAVGGNDASHPDNNRSHEAEQGRPRA